MRGGIAERSGQDHIYSLIESPRTSLYGAPATEADSVVKSRDGWRGPITVRRVMETTSLLVRHRTMEMSLGKGE